MMKVAGICAIVLSLPATTNAENFRLLLEPMHWSLERLDETYVHNVQADSRASARIALGAGMQWRAWQFSLSRGTSSSRTDFGLLDGPSARVERRDWLAQVRFRPPISFAGWGLQLALGFGHLQIRYRPESVSIVAGGEVIRVSLNPVETWTRSVAAELLHSVSTNSELVIQGGWRLYDLEIASPGGVTSQPLRDFQSGVTLRVRAF